MNDEQFIIAFGNPVDGFEYIGPFTDAGTANEYTDRWLAGGNNCWWIITLQKPVEDGND